MFILKLSPEMVLIIGKALGAQPYDAVAAVVVELQRQINEQQNIVPPPSSLDNQEAA